STEGDYSTRGAVQLLRGKPKEALAAYTEALKLDAHPYYAFFVALLASELGDPEARDRAIAAGRAYEPKDPKKTIVYGKELLASMAEYWAAGPDAKIDLKAWDALLATSDAVIKITLPYFVGRFLEIKGRKDDAKIYYQRASDAEIAQSRRLTVVLASDALRRLSK